MGFPYHAENTFSRQKQALSSTSFRVPVATPLVGVPSVCVFHQADLDTHKGRRY